MLASEAEDCEFDSHWAYFVKKLKVRKAFSAGGVVYREEPEGILWLVIKAKKDGQWRLPKGGIKKNETSLEAAQREVEEEAGVEVEMLGKIGHEKYFFVQDGQKIFKTVIFYLMRYVQEKFGGLDWETEKIDWLLYDEAKERLFFANEKKILVAAQKLLNNE